MNGDPRLYKLLDELHIPYEYLLTLTLFTRVFYNLLKICSV